MAAACFHQVVLELQTDEQRSTERHDRLGFERIGGARGFTGSAPGNGAIAPGANPTIADSSDGIM